MSQPMPPQPGGGAKNSAVEQFLRSTNWIVITGAPCAGKTAVICELEKRGYAVVHEAARRFIQQQLAQGLSLDQIKADPRRFEGRILDLKIKIESGLQPQQRIFFDRGVPDSIAYFQWAGLDPAAAFEKGRIHRYRRVFHLQRLPSCADGVRDEDDRQAARLDELLSAAYRRLGYRLLQVPLMPIAARTDWILAQL